MTQENGKNWQKGIGYKMERSISVGEGVNLYSVYLNLP